ncbi:hypothetical protein CYA_0098 [Synechococcus sp. JA-3-3Ab]|nr:hypothetical protein CYA_0098 [Synechococcus sp. JA-3-3Ab]
MSVWVSPLRGEERAEVGCESATLIEALESHIPL